MNEELVNKFKKIFSDIVTEPKVASAPGRVNIIGEHTDYNGGFVLPCALPLRTYVTYSPNNLDVVKIFSTAFDQVIEIDINKLPDKSLPAWTAYFQGVLAVFKENNIPLKGLDILVTSDVPVGGGLSSSAAAMASFGKAILNVSNSKIDKLDLAKMYRKAEQHYAGANVGIMDMLTAVIDESQKGIFIDCRDLIWNAIDLLPDYKFVVLNTGVKHELCSNEYNVRVEECNKAVEMLNKNNSVISCLRDATLDDLVAIEKDCPENIYRRAKHVITEDNRTIEAVKSIESKDPLTLGKLLNESHFSLRDDYEVSCVELDELQEKALKHPACIGSRMTGGGFGGCTVNLIQEIQEEDFIEHVGRDKYVCSI